MPEKKKVLKKSESRTKRLYKLKGRSSKLPKVEHQINEMSDANIELQNMIE